MSRKLLLLTPLIIVLVGTLGFAFEVQRVEAIAWTGTIYIRSDGSVDPFDAPIQRDGDYYALLENIVSNGDGIVIERNDTVIDGSGCTLQGNGTGSGVYLTGMENVTVKNTIIHSFGRGILAMGSSHTTIIENHVLSNYYSGIEIHECYEAFNYIAENNVTPNNVYGIVLIGSKNIFRNNLMTGNGYNFGVWGSLDNDVDTSNTVEGKPIYYWVNTSDMTVPSDAGCVVLMNCTRIIVQNLNLVKNGQGVLLISTANSTISQNYMANNLAGMSMELSSDNTVSGNIVEWNDNGMYAYSSDNNLINANNISRNLYDGIAMYSSENNKILENNIMHNDVGITTASSSSNQIHHNNFLNNAEHVYSSHSTNSWDNGVHGNFWDNYTGTDADHNGVGDTPHILDGSNQDRYPLMSPWSQLVTVPFFSQRDSGWKDDLMGLSGLKVGDYGCAMTCTAMVLEYYGVDTDPGVLNAWLSSHGGYTSGGALYWSKLAEYSEGRVQFVHSSEFWSFSSPSTKHWEKLDQELDQGRPVIVKVDFDPSSPFVEHWVLVTCKSGNDYYINDPWDSPQVPDKTLSHYGDTFYGMRFYDDIPSSGHTFTNDLTFGDSVFPIGFFSNSSISNLNLNESLMQLSFSVSGMSGNSGFCNVSVPKSLITGAPWTVWLANQSWVFLESGNSTHSFIYFNYSFASTLDVAIQATWVVPEFPSFLILPLFMIATLLAVIVYRRKHHLASIKK